MFVSMENIGLPGVVQTVDRHMAGSLLEVKTPLLMGAGTWHSDCGWNNTKMICLIEDEELKNLKNNKKIHRVMGHKNEFNLKYAFK